jgi:RimJ/RimL family protein N-acetyltransferase
MMKLSSGRPEPAAFFMEGDRRVISPAYRIHTPRLVLRCWNPGDAPRLKAAIDESLEHLRAWTDWAMREPSRLEEIVQRLRKFRAWFDEDENYTLGIFSRDESQVLGGTGLHKRNGPNALEIGYWLHKDHTGRGYATEATGALTRIAFELHCVPRLEVHCDPMNHRSFAIPARLGYRHEATLRHHSRTPDGRPRDSMIWAMLADEYPQSPSARIAIEAFDAAGARLLG